MTETLACARVRVLLEPFVDGELSAEQAESVRAHLATCDDCRLQHDQAVSLPFRMRALRSPLPPVTLLPAVMGSLAPAQRNAQRAWTLLIPEAVLAGFILWYLSGIEGLAALASGAWGDLQTLATWGAGSAPLPEIPTADVLLLGALALLSITAAYHLSVLARLADAGARPTLAERRRA